MPPPIPRQAEQQGLLESCTTVHEVQASSAAVLEQFLVRLQLQHGLIDSNTSVGGYFPRECAAEVT